MERAPDIGAPLNTHMHSLLSMSAFDILGGRDLFELWRLLLGTVCTIYAIVVTARSLWGWVEYLSGSDRTKSMMRKYVIVQLLRLHLRPFAWELAQIGFWALLFLVILYGHRHWVPA